MVINIVLTERIDGISYSYKTSPTVYSSYFNRIKKIRDSYKMYCIPISEYSDEWDEDAMCQYLCYKIDDNIFNIVMDVFPYGCNEFVNQRLKKANDYLESRNK